MIVAVLAVVVPTATQSLVEAHETLTTTPPPVGTCFGAQVAPPFVVVRIMAMPPLGDGHAVGRGCARHAEKRADAVRSGLWRPVVAAVGADACLFELS